MKSNISKFSWSELFSNNDGKTSGSGFVGVIICLVGTLCFFMGCLDKMFFTKSIDIVTQSIVFVGIGATLLGVRKVTAPKPKKVEEEEKSIQQINS
jgi:hypothetical protein